MVLRPALFRRIAEAERVVQISAPAGSGKTALIRSWLGQAPRDERLWVVVDDVHELDAEALRQLETLIRQGPPHLRFVLAARHELRLGLHRLRLEGKLAEIREPDLRFTVAEAGELFAAAGVRVPGAAVAALHARTEGWAAGLRLAALSLAGHPDPGRFAEAFSGTEPALAAYLRAEVLDRQSERARRLLLRTSILARVNGELADLLTGDEGGERVLQDLEQSGAFVVSLNADRSWFRYHPMLADLLRLTLRRTDPEQVTALHRAAAGWLAGHGYPQEAVRHARAAQDWKLAAALLAEREAVPVSADRGTSPEGTEAPEEKLVTAALSASEIRVLRYLPSNLSGPEIASELYLSHNTVRTHLRHLYAKLGTHGRADTVARARALGLLTPSRAQAGVR